jgi:hypothetical protein
MNTLEYMNIPSCYVPRADGGVEADTRAYHHVTQGMLHTPPLPSPHIAAGLLFGSQTPRLSSPTQLGQDAVLPAGNRGRWSSLLSATLSACRLYLCQCFPALHRLYLHIPISTAPETLQPHQTTNVVLPTDSLIVSLITITNNYKFASL